MITLNVELGTRSYPIYIGEQLLNDPTLISPYILGQQVLIVTNTTVAPLYLEQTRKLFSAYQCDFVILPDGEQHKNLTVLNNIYDALLKNNHDRDTTLVALGGGVVGDITGFAAATYQRGVHFIQIPTTLLSQVDSSVGGKTGVNHSLGKNMVGSFHQPKCVITDITTLNTLANRELSSGIAEVIKYGLLGDLAFTDWLEENSSAMLARQSDALVYAIKRSCENKALIVAADEREQGKRALLNLGHTFGHAIETGVGYGQWLHGEAVATGMLMAADLSHRIGWLNQSDIARIKRLLLNAQLPTEPPATLTESTFLALMKRDKKVKHGKIRLVLLKKIGDAMLYEDYDPQLLSDTIHHFVNSL